MQRLFFYVTLAPGKPNHHVVESIPGDWQPAILKGTLIEKGWGAARGFPAIVPSEDGERVAGFVFSSGHLDEYWPMLDCPFHYRISPALMSSSSPPGLNYCFYSK